MIQSKADLKEYIRADKKANYMERYYLLHLLYGDDGARVFRYLKSLRRLEYDINTGSIFYHLHRFINRRLGLKYGIFIVPNTVGKGLYIPHTQGVVIINCISMGCDCIVSGGCVVGNKDSQENRATIGNHVELTLGSKVIGKVNIEDNAIVAPNSVVIKDVPANAVVSGVPAKIIKIRE